MGVRGRNPPLNNMSHMNDTSRDKILLQDLANHVAMCTGYPVTTVKPIIRAFCHTIGFYLLKHTYVYLPKLGRIWSTKKIEKSRNQFMVSKNETQVTIRVNFKLNNELRRRIKLGDTIDV